MNQKPKAEEGNYYVGIADPVSVRRGILESSKAILQNLQQYEETKELRKERLGLQEKLIEETSELKTLINKLNRLMPRTAFKKQKPHKYNALQNELSSVEKELTMLKRS